MAQQLRRLRGTPAGNRDRLVPPSGSQPSIRATPEHRTAFWTAVQCVLWGIGSELRCSRWKGGTFFRQALFLEITRGAAGGLVCGLHTSPFLAHDFIRDCWA